MFEEERAVGSEASSSPGGAVGEDELDRETSLGADGGPGGDSGAAGNGAAEGGRERFIPRERFDQVNSKLERYRAYDDLIDEMEAMGGADVVRAAKARASEEMTAAQRQKFEQKVDIDLRSLVESGQMDQSAADLLAPQLKQLGAVKPLLAEFEQSKRERAIDTQVTALTKQFSGADPETVRDALLAGRDGKKAAERSHNRHAEIISKYVAAKGAGAGGARPEGGGGGAGPTRSTPPPNPVTHPKEFAEWRKARQDEAWKRQNGDP